MTLLIKIFDDTPFDVRTDLVRDLSKALNRDVRALGLGWASEHSIVSFLFAVSFPDGNVPTEFLEALQHRSEIEYVEQLPDRTLIR